MMVCLWLYAYGVGVFSSRKIALACARTLAFLAIVGQDRPAFRTLSDFRTLHLEACKDVFGQVVRLAAEAGLVQAGNVATDGTTIQGHASRHQAMSDGYMPKAVERLREAIEAWVTQAYQQDAADDAAWGSRRGDALPAELARREDRLARIAAAMRRVGSPGQSSSGGGAPTDGEATSRQGPDTRGGQPQRQGPEPLDGSRAA
jgi:hypothetical protein